MNILDKYYLQYEYSSYRTTSVIDLSNRSIIEVDHFAFSNAYAIQFIDLSHNSLSSIGHSFNLENSIFVDVKHLSSIDLSHNKIVYIETNSFLAYSCEILDLSFNSLTLLHSNQLFSNKEEYSNLKSNQNKLKTLKLNNNKLNEISSLFEYESTDYPLLTNIHLEFNLLTEISANTFTNVKSLT